MVARGWGSGVAEVSVAVKWSAGILVVALVCNVTVVVSHESTFNKIAYS